LVEIATDAFYEIWCRQCQFTNVVRRELRDETGRMRKAMAEKDHEIKRMNKKLLKAEEDKRLLSGTV